MSTNNWLKPGSRWVLASGNKGKLAELAQALTPLQLDLHPISEWTDHSPEENGDSFEANALIKARHAAGVTGLPSLADDSGLAVDALDGAPGIYSARYAGAHASDSNNNAKLLEALRDTPDSERTARFVCVIALVRSAQDAHPIVVRGEWEGLIAQSPAGTQGFGYDPLFITPDLKVSAAELSPEDKLTRSHRGHAIRLLYQRLHALRSPS